MQQNLKLKSISELLEYKFNIPSYQRGYRWEKQQVEDLLNDIMEFAHKSHFDKRDGFYCLQPIVVKAHEKDDKVFDVLDGQQRLTTIYILLRYFIQQTKTNLYTISYETRIKSNDFLENKLDKLDESNIDFFYMSHTYKIIEKWSENKDFATINLFLMYLLQKPRIEDGIDVSNNIRVIWYELEKSDNVKEIDIFTRINMGKIPLTNSELIKALLLNNIDNYNKKFELATEWDNIEYTLQNDEFWLFLNKKEDKNNTKPTRIDFVFELLSSQYLDDLDDGFRNSLNKSIDVYYTFHIMNHIATAKQKDTKEIWKDIKDIFRILQEWYENIEFFHKIGFLAEINKDTSKLILSLLNKYKESNKETFTDQLNRLISCNFDGISFNELEYKENNKKNNRIIKNILLLFNIETILSDKDSNIKFQFDRYKKDDWDIEHIRSQTDKYPNTEKEKIQWFEDVKDLLSEDDKNKWFSNAELDKEEIKNNDTEFKSLFNKLYKNIEKKDDSNEEFDTHSIGNLALLDSETNRSYGNAFFQIKRKTIIENDKVGKFIPIATKNLFLKYYSNNIDNLLQWNTLDANNYQKEIKYKLSKYLEVNEDCKNDK